MFSADDRDRVRERLLERARTDPRIVAAAAVGSSAWGGDRWSDLDLTFGVADGIPVAEVLAGWSDTVVTEFDAAVLFDLPHGASIYRVFLLPGMLQVDLSFTPAAEFGARGPRFELLFGEAIDHPVPPPASSEHRFGLAIHHLVRAAICIERRKPWQAEYWIHEARDETLALACRRLGLEESHGRGFDTLPEEIRGPLAGSLVGDLTVDELRRAMRGVLVALLRETSGMPQTARVRPIVADLVQTGAE